MDRLLRITADGLAVIMELLLCVAVLPLTAELFGIQTYCVQSGSMEPVLKTGSIIFADKTDVVEPGDIIAFQKWDMVVTHRVLYEENGNYITKGDANIRKDAGSVSKNQLKGKIMKLPGGGYCVPYVGYLQAAVVKWKWGILGLLLVHKMIKQKKEGEIYGK